MNSPIQPAAAGGASSPEGLLESIRAELRLLQAAVAPAKPEAVVREKPAIPKVAAPRQARNWGPTVAVAAGIAVVLVAGLVAFHFVFQGIVEQNARATLRRVAGEKDLLNTWLAQGDAFRADKDFPKALDKFSAVAAKADLLLRKLRKDAERLPKGELKGQIAAAIAEVDEYLKTAEQGLSRPEIARGGRGEVRYMGEWVAPEEKEKLEAERNRADGKKFYANAWRTPEEVHRLRGEVFYEGAWIAKAEYEKLMAEKARQETTPATKPATDKPPVTATQPPPRTLKPQKFDPSSARWVLDDFEQGVRWSVVPWKKTNPCKLTVISGTETNRLQITMSGGEYDKSAIVRSLGLDFSSRGKLAMDIVNDCNEPVRIALAVETDTYYESRWRTLRLGKNKSFMFNLIAGDFKCAPHWTHSTRIKHPETAGWLYLLIYSDRPGKILIDNIAAVGSD